MLDPKRLRSVSIVYEDEYLLAVNKPAGLSVHDGASAGANLLDVLTKAGSPKLWLAHRLDRATSGVVLCCKQADVAKLVQANWQKSRKQYRALVLGQPAAPQTIRTPIKDSDGRNQDASSEMLACSPAAGLSPVVSWVTLCLGTGRKHQLRKHLASAGHPILMDDKYGDFAANKSFRRAVSELGLPRPKHLFLHAECLELDHPHRAEPLVLRADPPAGWQALEDVALVDGSDSPG